MAQKQSTKRFACVKQSLVSAADSRLGGLKLGKLFQCQLDIPASNSPLENCLVTVIHNIDKSARTSARINTVAQQQIICGQTSFAGLQ